MIDEATLAQMNGEYVMPPDAGPAWRAAHAAGIDMSLIEDALKLTPEQSLQTDLGKLDCLSEVAGVGDFAAVLKQSVVANLSYGEFRFLNLDALIAAKKTLGRERDLDAVRRLIAIKEKSEQQKNLL